MADRLLSPKEVADYCGVPVATVYSWQTKGVGPRTIRVGRHSRVRDSDLQAWLEANTGARTRAASLGAV